MEKKERKVLKGQKLSYYRGPILGQGTYGIVYSGEVINSEGSGGGENILSKVALKKLKMPDATEGVPVVGLREIKLLQELDHPNILKLVDVFVQPSLKHAGSIYLGYEIMTNSFDNLVPREP